ncbi:hypothetical protein J4226_03850 [Candidatus Pacearchaeota archaeon]|nr:hypothetical protein [Candidatus Pacearchaeota archaeon]
MKQKPLEILAGKYFSLQEAIGVEEFHNVYDEIKEYQSDAVFDSYIQALSKMAVYSEGVIRRQYDKTLEILTQFPSKLRIIKGDDAKKDSLSQVILTLITLNALIPALEKETMNR